MSSNDINVIKTKRKTRDFVLLQPSVITRNNNIDDDGDALDTFAALERQVTQTQPRFDHLPTNNTSLVTSSSTTTTSSSSKSKRTKASVVSMGTVNDDEDSSSSSTFHFQPRDNNIIVSEENDEDAVVNYGNDIDDDDDVEFIVHDELESSTPAAVAAALKHHENKVRGKNVRVAGKKKKKKTKPGNEDDDNKSVEDDDEDDLNNKSSNKKQKNWIQKRMSELMPKGGIVSSAANISASTLGSGSLIIAFCFERSAIVPGAVTLLVNASFTVYTIWLLMRMLDRLGEESYEGIATRLCGSRFGKSAALCVALFGWGCAAVYAAVLKSVLAPFVPYLFPDPITTAGLVSTFSMANKKKLFAAAIGLVTQVPLALKEEMNSLRFVSTIGTFSIIILVVSVVHHALAEDSVLTSTRIDDRIAIPSSTAEFFATMGIFVFSFCCQTNTFPVYEEMSDRSAERMSVASVFALAICTIFYLLVGVSGLAAFGSDIKDNIVENFILDGAGNMDSILCCVSVGVTVLGCFPVAILPAREAILEAFGYDKDRKVRLGLGIFLAISALLTGILSPSLVTICSLVGGAVGTWISYIFPVYLTYKHGELLSPSSPYFDRKHVVMCVLVIICGAGAGTLGSVMSVVHALQN